MQKILGFDIGISSIGWAYLNDDKLIDCGVRIFTKAEQSDGASLALPRREARSARRRIRRRRARMVRLKHLICKEFSIKFDEFINKNYQISSFFKDNKLSVYEIRTKALKEKLNINEFIRALLHIAKHRGYNDKLLTNDKGTIINFLKQNEDNMHKFGYESIGEYLNNEFFQKPTENSKNFKNVRNKKDNYNMSLPQTLLKDEMNLIFDRQKEFGLKFSDKFKDEFIKIAFHTRPLKDFSHLVGECSFYTNEKRAPKNSISSIKFVALTKIINEIKNLKNTYGLLVDDEKIKEILDFVLQNGKITYKKFGEFVNFSYEKSGNFIEFKNYIAFKKALGVRFNDFNEVELDEIARILTLYKDEKRLKDELKRFNLDINEELFELNFKEFINLSLKALYEILPLMQNGSRYDEAVDKLIENRIFKEKRTQKSELLPPFCETNFKDDLTNPVVNRAIAEYRKVLNSLIKKYGKMHKIKIELTRETGRNFKDRQNIKKQQDNNLAKNEEAKRFCENIGLNVNHKNILKVKLFIEQNEICVYSGKKITISNLLDEKMLEVDHILPYSRSFDDSYNNKVLVFSAFNQVKGNKTPYEAFGNDENKWNIISARAEVLKKVNKIKYTNLMTKEFKDKKFKDRNLNDTSYIATLIKNYTKNYLEFLPLAENDESKIHVEARSGRLTTNLRHFMGFEKKDRDNHLHHALDAVILAYSNQSLVQSFANYYKTKELSKAKLRTKDDESNAYEKFISVLNKINLNKDEIYKKIDEIFVSQPPRKKVTGALHQETFYKRDDFYKEYGGEDGVKRALELGKIRQIGTKIVSNGEMIRVDIFEKNNKFYGVPIYTMDIALGILPNKACVVGKDKNGVIKDWLLMDESFKFKFSLYPNDLIRIKKKEMKEAEFLYFINFTTSTASMNVKKHDNKIENLTPNQLVLFSKAKAGEVVAKSIGIQGLEVFEKYIITPLGEIKDYIYKEREQISLKSSKK